MDSERFGGESQYAPEDGTISSPHISGSVKSTLVRKLQNLVDTQPDKTVSILRSWIHRDSGN
ncbi:MAG: hypothetical protein AAF220_07925 [Pseudomonadota bacterium]